MSNSVRLFVCATVCLACEVLVAGQGGKRGQPVEPCGLQLSVGPNSFVTNLLVAGENWAVGSDYGTTWFLTLCRTNDFQKKCEVRPLQCGTPERQELPDGVRIVWRPGEATDAGACLREVWITVRTIGDRNRWRMGYDVKPGWALVRNEFPRLTMKLDVGGNDDHLMSGGTVSGVITNPADEKRNPRGWMVVYRQAFLSGQYFCRYTSDRLFYFGCEDTDGNDKEIHCTRNSGKSLLARWVHNGWTEGRGEIPYDVVTAVLRPRNMLGCDWFDAADFYRSWAEKQWWCAKKLRDRDDLAEVYKQGPTMAFFDRGWIESPWRILKWVDQRKKEGLGEIPLFVSLIGWEKWCDWIGPDYYPMHPSDESVKGLMKGLRERKARTMLWPSSYDYAVKFKVPDYYTGKKTKPGDPLDFDHTENVFREGVDKLFVHDEKGGWTHDPGWTGTGGALATLCPAAPGTQEWFERTSLRPLMERGAVALQLDQLDHVLWQRCWRHDHGHLPNTGPWLYKAVRKNLEKSLAIMKEYDSEASIAGEGPNEQFIGIYAMQDTRDCRFWGDAWAYSFNYLYHEYVMPFQPGCPANEIWYAKCAAEGQMPQFSFETLRTLYDSNFEFKDPLWKSFYLTWCQLYHGEGRKYLALGRHVRPPRMICGTTHYKGEWRGVKYDRDVPAVFHAQFKAADGSRAVSLANATSVPQKGELLFGNGKRLAFELGPRELHLITFKKK